jgi:hypothetical protein
MIIITITTKKATQAWLPGARVNGLQRTHCQQKADL